MIRSVLVSAAMLDEVECFDSGRLGLNEFGCACSGASVDLVGQPAIPPVSQPQSKSALPELGDA